MINCDYCKKNKAVSRYKETNGSIKSLCPACLEASRKHVCRVCGTPLTSGNSAKDGVCIECAQIEMTEQTAKEDLEAMGVYGDDTEGEGEVEEMSEQDFNNWLIQPLSAPSDPKKIKETRLSLLHDRLDSAKGWSHEKVEQYYDNLAELMQEGFSKVISTRNYDVILTTETPIPDPRKIVAFSGDVVVVQK